jgi:eukaryotic-like serine/threonine-protein kinase
MLKTNDTIFDDNEQEYKILKPLGSGGMGYILLAKRQSDNKEFAIKTLSIFIDGDSDHQALINEMMLASKIKHTNVMSYIYFHDGEKFKELPPYIIMELANTNTLQDVINQHAEKQEMIPQNNLLNLYSKLIDGMEAINEILIHRDVKPSNILFKDEELKISDFGIAKAAGDPTRTKSFKGSGTLAFLPPETFLNQNNTIQMDIYSMGLVFFLLATLKHPYQINNEKFSDDEWKNAHLSTVPASIQSINSNLSIKISTIVQKMLEKKPEKRFNSWEEIRKELQTIDALETSPHASIIQKMMASNIQKKNEKAQTIAEHTKKAAEQNQKIEMIQYSFNNDVIKPAKDFIDNYNSINPDSDDKIEITNSDSDEYDNNSRRLDIAGPSSSMTIKLHILNEMDSLTRVSNDMFGETINKKIEPELQGKSILAWGYFKKNTGEGFNLVLCKSENSPYGDWFTLTNEHSAIATRQDNRPDPFPFELDEIREEIHHIPAMHIYNTQVSALTSEIIIKIISDL